MDKNLKPYLEKYGISYKVHHHPPVFTVAESLKLKGEISEVLHTKNLFLKDEKNNFYLVCLYAHKRLNLKFLKERLQAAKKLEFASEKELKEHLNVLPGSVSIFSIIYAKDVTLILDKQIWEAEKVGFHPNINTATLELTHEDFEKFWKTIKAKKDILPL